MKVPRLQRLYRKYIHKLTIYFVKSAIVKSVRVGRLILLSCGTWWHSALFIEQVSRKASNSTS